MRLKVCLAQIEPTTGSVRSNLERVKSVVKSYEADLYVFPEMFLVGYTAKDLLYRLAMPHSASSIRELQVLARSSGVGVVVGFPELAEMGYVYNALLAVDDKGGVFVYRKRHLPTFSVFDEHRWFKPCRGPLRTWKFKGVDIGFSICYDLFFPEITKAYALKGVKLQVAISAAPDTSVPLFHKILVARALETTTYIIWVNLVGIMDGLTFGGGSVAVDPLGNFIVKLKEHEEDVKVVSLDLDSIYRYRIARPVLRDSMREDAEELLKAYSELEA